MTFTQSAGAFSGLTATDLAVKKPLTWWRKRLATNGLTAAKLTPQAAPTGHSTGPVARKRTKDMNQFRKMVEALQTSVNEVVAAAPADRDALLAKSFEQFADRAEDLIEASMGELQKQAPDYAGMDHVALLGHAAHQAADAVRVIEAGGTAMNVGMGAPDPEKIELAKSAINLLGNAVQLMAIEQATVMDDGEDPTQENLGMAKVSFGGEEVMLKHALSEPAMAWLADPEQVRAQAVEASLEALESLGINTAPLLKAFEDEDEDEDEDEEEEEGEEDEGEEDEGEEDEEGDGGDEFASSGSPLVDLARLGTLAMLTVDAIKQQAAEDGVEEGQMAALDAIGQHGAFMTVQADQLLRAQQGEGGEEGEMAEEEMALAAKSDELAKAARHRLGLAEQPMAKAAPAAPAPAPQPQAPMLKAVAINKVEDAGGKVQETADQMAKRLAEQPLEKAQQELIKMALTGTPIPLGS